uniref:Uncharacterized protein n=1 Tax=Tanacetum cinerariifolium TaxID=118510 RepID=A0A699GLN9_TANCI|nr:hypothetical protein [Tanacetum cinerariifolium]
MNQKLLRSLSLEWNTHAVVWRNKSELETMSMDDIYNNLKVYKLKVKGMSSSISSTQNIAFVSSSNNNTSSTNEIINAAYGVSTASTQANVANIGNVSDVVIFSFFVSQSNSPQLAHEDLQQIHPDDIEEMDLRWRMAIFDKSKVECYNCHKTGHFARECQTLRNQDYKNKDNSRRSMNVETPTSTALMSCDGLGGYDWSDQAEEGIIYALLDYLSLSSDLEDIQVGEITIRELRKKLEKVQKEKDDIQFNVYKLENVSKSLNKIIESQILDNCKKGLGYNVVPPLLTGNFMPLKLDLCFIGLEEFVNDHVVENRKTNEKVSDNYEELDTGYVAFRGNPKGGKITEKGSRLDWLFDIDALTRTMNYELIVAGKKSNGIVGTKASTNTGQTIMDIEYVQKYILLPLWNADLPLSQNLESSQDDGISPSSDDGKKVNEDLRTKNESKYQEKEDNVSSANNVNTASTNKVNAADVNTSIILLVNPNMPTLENNSIFDYSNDEDVGTTWLLLLQKPRGSEDFHQILDFLNASHIRTLDNGEIELNATVDGQDKTITEASIRRHLKLADANGISILPTTEIFKQFALMGTNSLAGATHQLSRGNTSSLAVAKYTSSGNSAVGTYEAITKEMHDGSSMATTTTFSLEAKQGSGYISKTQTKATPSGPSALRTSLKGGPWCDITMGLVLFRPGLKGYLTCLMNHLLEKVTHLEVRMTKEIDEDKNINLVKSSNQGEAHETAGHRIESNDTEVVDFGTTSSQNDDDEITLVETLVNIKKSAAKHKGKAIMQEFKSLKKIKKKETMQISHDEELAQNLHVEELAKDTARQEQEQENMILKMPWNYKSRDVGYYEIHKADGTYKTYTFFSEMLNVFDREALIVLDRLFNGKYASTRPEVSIHMLVEKEYPLLHDTLIRMLQWKLHVNYNVTEMAYELLSGCSRHMTGNMYYLSNFKEFDRGYVTFRGGAKGGKITGKGTFKTVPRKNNMYSVDMKNIVPKDCLTCLVAKDTLEESMLWYRRLRHVNFKTINKLVNENLVKGLPTKCFENDQTCVACLKEKQHEASCIKRESSVARTPQQNGVAERRNMTLVEAARTMLADFKLNITFWAEAINTACYVQNRVLVVKPHNKTLYELFRGRTPALSFMRPFGCHVTILNTLDYLGKFDGKSNEVFFVGYSLNSKAFRIYNIRTRKVEESLHIRFLDEKPIVAADGLKWMFDIDVLTKLMNYLPVVTVTNFNDFIDGLLFDSSSKNDSNNEPQPSSDARKKDDDGVNKERGITDQERPENSTQDVNTAGTSINTGSKNVNTSSLNINTVSPTVTTVRPNGSQTEPNMFSLGNNATLEAIHANFFRDETEMDISNITTTYPEEPKRITKALSDLAWVEGHTQEKGIDYDEVFAPMARIEAIRLFLACASFMGFMVYQMDVKSSFLYETFKEEVYVCQPLGFEDPDYPDKIYKRKDGSDLIYQEAKRGYFDCTGLQVKQKEDRIFISQDKYVVEILKKFGFTYVKSASTLVDTKKPLLKDLDGDNVDVHLYMLIIRSLIYLTSSRPGIMFTCKKQTMVATSSTKVKYVAAASCCGQVPIFQGEGSTIPVESYHTPIGDPSTSYPPPSPTSKSSIRQETGVSQPSSPPNTNVADKAASISMDVRHEIQGRQEHDMEFKFDLDAAKDVSTEISTASLEVKTAGDSGDDIATETLVYIKRSAVKAKDKADSSQATVTESTTAGSSKKDAKEELSQESSKRQKTRESPVSAEEPKDKDEELRFAQKELGSTGRSSELEIILRVNHVSTEKGIDIYMLIEEEYPLSRGTLT